VNVFAIDVKDNAGRTLGNQLHQQHLGEVTFARTLDASHHIDLLKILPFDREGLSG
jgi:hypothetical protein